MVSGFSGLVIVLVMPDNMKSFFSMETHEHLTMNIKVLFGLIKKELFFRYTCVYSTLIL
jgi:hypothetical protein